MSKQKFSPKKYIVRQARKLPLGSCYINADWKETGLASIMVTRRHTNGNFTIGIYLTDLLAMGVKDSDYRFNMTEEELNMLIQGGDTGIPFEEIDYVLVHNIIYGANAFAEDHGFKPHKDFRITQFILEEDTEDIELIELGFGKDGEPLLIDL